MADRLADAQAWYDRAQDHIREYRRLAYGEHDRIWTVRPERLARDRFVYSLRFDRNLLPRLKPVACEAANALFQSLDNIIGVAARGAGVDRKTQISWPWAIEPDPASSLPGAVKPAIDKRLKILRKEGLPDPWLALIEQTFATPAAGLSHIDVLKEVSLSGKHWELVPTDASALAISWTPPGATRPVIVDIPKGHFETNDDYVFHDGVRVQTPRLQIVTGTRLVAATKDFEPEPVAAFDYASRFVTAALEGAKRLL